MDYTVDSGETDRRGVDRSGGGNGAVHAADGLLDPDLRARRGNPLPRLTHPQARRVLLDRESKRRGHLRESLLRRSSLQELRPAAPIHVRRPRRANPHLLRNLQQRRERRRFAKRRHGHAALAQARPQHMRTGRLRRRSRGRAMRRPRRPRHLRHRGWRGRRPLRCLSDHGRAHDRRRDVRHAGRNRGPCSALSRRENLAIHPDDALGEALDREPSRLLERTLREALALVIVQSQTCESGR